MNLIIDLIIKIFQTLFEEDRKRRTPLQAQEQGLPAARPEQRKPQTLDDWLQDIFAEEGAQPQVAPPPPPPPVARPHRALQAQTETLTEHILKEERRSHRQDDRAKAMDKHVHDYLGDENDDYKIDNSVHQFSLPGKTPLQQVLYAHVIFGPCKARRNMGGKFQNL